MRLVAVGLALLVVSPPAAACPAPHLVDVPLIADGATLLDDGGVVIETRSARGGGDEAMGLQLTSGGAKLGATRDFIASGLWVLRPPRGDGRTIEVVDGASTVRWTLTQAKGTGPHAAPKATRMTSSLGRERATKRAVKMHRGVAASVAELTLAEAPPDDVLAVVVFRITKDGSHGIAWWPRNEAELVYGYSTGGKGCVPGPSPVHLGEKVAIGFIDLHGRTSPLSRPLVVTAFKKR